jgi:hypothetical protein
MMKMSMSEQKSLSSDFLKKALSNEKPIDQMHRNYPFKVTLAVVFF